MTIRHALIPTPAFALPERAGIGPSDRPIPHLARRTERRRKWRENSR